MTRTRSPSLSLGRLWYFCYHSPRAWLQDRTDQAAARIGENAMRAAAATLPAMALPEWGLAGPPCRFLTGARFVHQTIFCARSFEWSCNTHVRIEIFSDGTLSDEHRTLLKRALPHAMLVGDETIEKRLDRVLPAGDFPALRHMRAQQPLMRKILDLRAGLDGFSLYLDSDMLFFSPPIVLRDWLHTPVGGYFMQQNGDALVGRREQLERTWGQILLPGVNSGIIAIDDSAIDWVALEKAASCLTAAEQSHHWAEQTLFAWQLSRGQATPLSSADYFLCNRREDTGQNPPSLRHYVNKSKWRYTADEWRRWLELSGSPASSRV